MKLTVSRMNAIILAALSASILACATDHQDSNDQGSPELVLCPGSTIRISTNSGSIAIEAISTVKRRFVIADVDTIVDLAPREARWNGSLGLSRSYGTDDLHLVLEEALLFFDSQRDLLRWLEWANNEFVQMRYTSDGLAVRWRLETFPEPMARTSQALHADVYQLLIRGAKPQSLPGSNDSAFTIEASDPECTIGDKRHSTYVPSQPKVIDGRHYSGWAIDIMRAHKITPEMVEMAIDGNSPSLKTAKPLIQGEHTIYFYVPRIGTYWHGSFVVTVDRTGAVVFMHI